MEGDLVKIRILQATTVSTEQIVKKEGGNEAFQQIPPFQEVQAVIDEPDTLAQAIIMKGPFKFHAGQRVEISILPSNKKED